MSTQRNTALVTGASRGIGRGIALALADCGYDIAVNYAGNTAAAEETCALIAERGRKAVAIKADISSTEDRAFLVAEFERVFGPMNLLVNNAGRAPRVRADILEATEESYDEVMDVNLKGPYFLTQAVSRRMTAWRREGVVSHPRIVFVTSISAFTASPSRGEYCLSKAGLSMAVKLFASRLAGEGIGVFEVQPGIIRTDMTSAVTDKYDKLIEEDGLLPIPRWGTPDDIGQAVAAVAEGRLDYSTGQTIRVDGGFHLRIL